MPQIITFSKVMVMYFYVMKMANPFTAIAGFFRSNSIKQAPTVIPIRKCLYYMFHSMIHYTEVDTPTEVLFLG